MSATVNPARAEEPSEPALGTLQTSGWTVAWRRDAAGAVDGTVEVVPLPDRRLSYTLVGRLVLGELDLSWTDGPFSLPPTGNLALPVALPTAAYASDAQLSVLADLAITVVAEQDGEPIDALPAAYARVAFPGGPAAPPLFYDQAEATRAAPSGVLGEAPAVPAPLGEVSTGHAAADEVAP